MPLSVQIRYRDQSGKLRWYEVNRERWQEYQAIHRSACRVIW